MEYYLIDTLPQVHDHLALIDGLLRDGEGNITSNIPYCTGERCAEKHPSPCRTHMDEDWPGIRLGGLIANTESLLVVHSALREAIAKRTAKTDEIEYLPLEIVNHKGRIASRDYWIINPIGTLDCLDEGRSSVDRDAKGEIVDINTYVLSKKKLAHQPAVFRPKGDEFKYIFSIDVLSSFKDTGLKDRNVYGTELSF